MRKIEFRGLRTDGKGWVYGMLFHNNKIVTETVSYESPMVEKGSPNYKYEYINVIPESVGQFTGLNDKNGEMIFEGDIILHKEAKGSIYYDNDLAMYIVRFPLLRSSYSFDSIHGEIELYGNIHENKELLK